MLSVLLSILLMSQSTFALPDPTNGSRDCPSALKKRLVFESFTRGLDHEDDIIGYHGTGVEVLNHAMTTGYIPAVRKMAIVNGTWEYVGEFGIHFMPANIPFGHGEDRRKLTHREAIKEATGYAQFNAPGQRLLDLLGIKWSSESLFAAREVMSNSKYYRLDLTWDFANFLTSENVESNLNVLRAERYFAPNKLRESIREAHASKGIVIAIKKSALEKYRHQDVYPDEGFFLKTGENGLPLEFVSGIEPVGQPEWDYLVGTEPK